MPKITKTPKPIKKSAASSAKAPAKKRKILRSEANTADNLHQRTNLSEVVIDFVSAASKQQDKDLKKRELAWDLDEFVAKEDDYFVPSQFIIQDDPRAKESVESEAIINSDHKVVLDKNGQKTTANRKTNLHRSGHLLDLRPTEKVVKPEALAPGPFSQVQASSFLTWSHKLSFHLPKWKKQPRFEREEPMAATWLPSIERLRIVLTFAVFAFLLVVPVKGFVFYKNINVIKDKLVGFSQAAASDLQSGVQAATIADWQGALTKFQSAEVSLSQAADYLQNTQANLQQVLFGLNPLASADHLITGATQLTKLAEQFTASLALWTNQQQAIDKQLPWIQQQLADLLPQAQAANTSLQLASTFGLPDKYKNQIKELQTFLPYFINQLTEIKSLTETLSQALGYNQEKRYLIIFQNSNEERATGGFIGSFAQVDVDNAEIKNMVIPGGGPYDLQGQSTSFTISPDPMHLVGKDNRWMLWDANWWPDFPTSAQKFQDFYQKSGGPTTDGVLAINSSLMPKLLNLVGPVTLPKFQVTLTADNFVKTVQKQVEFDYDKTENKPKQIIAEAAPIILARLQNLPKEKYTQFFAVLLDALKQKEVQAYFNDSDIQQKADSFQWTGRVLPTTGDYTMVVDQNISGGKSDAYVTQTLDQYINFSDNGSILKTININRSLAPVDPTDVFSSSTNYSFIRVYAPQAAQLLNVTGQIWPSDKNFQTTADYLKPDPDLARVSGQVTIDPLTKTSENTEFSKKVFGNWLTLFPGDKKTIAFNYSLPASLIQWQTTRLQDWLNKLGWHQAVQGRYELLIQKQAGLNNQKVVTHFSWPSSYQVEVGQLPAKATVESQAGGLTITYTQTQDETIVLNITK